MQLQIAAATCRVETRCWVNLRQRFRLLPNYSGPWCRCVPYTVWMCDVLVVKVSCSWCSDKLMRGVKKWLTVVARSLNRHWSLSAGHDPTRAWRHQPTTDIRPHPQLYDRQQLSTVSLHGCSHYRNCLFDVGLIYDSLLAIWNAHRITDLPIDRMHMAVCRQSLSEGVSDIAIHYIGNCRKVIVSIKYCQKHKNNCHFILYKIRNNIQFVPNEILLFTLLFDYENKQWNK